jgi:sugar phosphate permease
MGRLGLGPMGTFIRADLSITRAQFGFFITAISFGFGLSVFVAGWLADRLGIRKVLTFAQVIVGVCLISILFAKTYTGCLVIMFLSGISMGLIQPGLMKALIIWFPLKERATAMGIVTLAVNFGGLITASTLPALATVYGWRAGFLAMGIFAIVFGIIFCFLYRSHSSEKGNRVLPAASGEDLTSKSATNRSDMLSLLKSREHWLLTISASLLAVIEFSVLNFFVIYLKEHILLPVVTAGFMLGVLDAAGICGKFFTGLISDRIFGGKRKQTFIALSIAATVVCAAIAFFTKSTPQWLIFACSAILGLAAFGWTGLFFTMIGEQTGKEHIGVVNGAAMGITVFAYACGVPIFGYLADKTHGWGWSWTYVVGIGVISTLCLFFVREERRKI